MFNNTSSASLITIHNSFFTGYLIEVQKCMKLRLKIHFIDKLKWHKIKHHQQLFKENINLHDNIDSIFKYICSFLKPHNRAILFLNTILKVFCRAQ